MLHCSGPASISALLPFLHHRVFKDIGFINARDKLRHFIVVSDLDGVLRGIVFRLVRSRVEALICWLRELLQGAMKVAFVATLSVFVMTGQVQR